MATNTEAFKNPDLIMVTEADEDHAGATIWWRLEGDVDRRQLHQALRDLGYADRIPPTREPEVALRRAAANLRSKRRLLRPVRKGVWAIVEEQVLADKDSLKHWEGPTVSLDKIGRPSLRNATAEEARIVTDAYQYHLGALTTEDVSSWLIEQAERLGAVALRRGGGIYYMPPSGLTAWGRIISALTSVQMGHSVYKVPTVKMTADGARAILDSLEEELHSTVDHVGSELITGELGTRALETREAKSRDLLLKVRQFESLLGSKLDGLIGLVEKLQTDIVAAKLAAEADEDGAS